MPVFLNTNPHYLKYYKEVHRPHTEHPPHRLGLERARPEPLELGRRAGQDDNRCPAHLEHESRRGAGEPERDCACGKCRLLADAVLEVGVRPPQALGDRARDGADLGVKPLVEHKAAARSLRDQLDGTVVVRRPKTARDQTQVRLQACPQRGLELVRPVADDRDPCRLEPERQRLAGEEGAVQVGAFAANELAARDDDRDLRRPLRARCQGLRGRCRPR